MLTLLFPPPTRLLATAAALLLSLAPARAADYLFSYFTNNGEDGLHLAWSTDGYTWAALNGGKSFLAPKVGKEKLMRDPCLLLGPDGTFRMVWTDSWSDKSIGYASSKDLLTWSEQTAVPVMATEPTARNCWAPEVDYDAKQGDYVIFWATTITGKFPETATPEDQAHESGYNHRIYRTTTRDFATFTPTQLFYEPGFNVIDATMLAANDRFWLIVKDETITPVPKKNLRLASSDSPEGPFTNLSAPFSPAGVWAEGPTALKVGDDYVVYYDMYRDHKYGAVRSRDLKAWEDVSARLHFPAGMRHGTALAVPHAVVEKLQALPGKS